MARILSWNVNGIRSIQKKGFLEWLRKTSPDVLCIQETKAHEDQFEYLFSNHKPIDLARPKEDENVSGFLPVERAWLDRWIEQGQVDIFREFSREPKQYTWWDLKTNARERNVGWRIDYHFVTQNMMPFVKSASILSEVRGSDHCPVSLEFFFP